MIVAAYAGTGKSEFCKRYPSEAIDLICMPYKYINFYEDFSDKPIEGWANSDEHHRRGLGDRTATERAEEQRRAQTAERKGLRNSKEHTCGFKTVFSFKFIKSETF